MREPITDIELYFQSHSVSDYLSHHWPEAATHGFILDSARSGLLFLLERLDSLDRKDPFWINTNRCPTMHKLINFIEIIRGANPDSLDLAWGEIGFSFLYFSEGLSTTPLLRIYSLQPFDPFLVVQAGYQTSKIHGHEVVADVGEFLYQTSNLDRVPEFAAALVASGIPDGSDWLTNHIRDWESGKIVVRKPSLPTLGDYIWKYCSKWMTEDEREAQHLVQVREKARSMTSRGLAAYLLERHGTAKTQEVDRLANLGFETLRAQIRDRILRDSPEVLRRCPFCTGLLRTPHACQCPRCFRRWDRPEKSLSPD